MKIRGYRGGNSQTLLWEGKQCNNSQSKVWMGEWVSLWGEGKPLTSGRRMWKGGRSAKDPVCPGPHFSSDCSWQEMFRCLQLITWPRKSYGWRNPLLAPKSFFPFLLVPFFFLLIFHKAMNKRRKKLKEKEESIY